MKTTHTPGPWKVVPTQNPRNGTEWREIHSTGTPFSPSYVGEALRQDAHLMAAAPDLLSALEGMCELYGGSINVSDVKKAALIAISKATRHD